MPDSIAERPSTTAQPIRVLIVDDSVFFRSLLRETLSREADIEVVGSAASGEIALEQCSKLRPDLITLDIVMPGMSGVQTLEQIRATNDQVAIIVCSSLGQENKEVIEVSQKGADDFYRKESQSTDAAATKLKLTKDLIPRIRAIVQRKRSGDTRTLKQRSVIQRPGPVEAPRSSSISADVNPPADSVSLPRTRLSSRPEIIAIGSSTGGPKALAEIVAKLDRRFDIPIVLVQHMPSAFTQQLADRLTVQGPIPAIQVTHGMPIIGGKIYIAPGDFHLEIERSGLILRAILQQGPKENSCRPAVDVLFRSVAQTFGNRSLSLVLTGMGADGEIGCHALRKAGGTIWVQDEATSVIWGMPGAVAKAGLANKILPLDTIASELNTVFQSPSRVTSK